MDSTKTVIPLKYRMNNEFQGNRHSVTHPAKTGPVHNKRSHKNWNFTHIQGNGSHENRNCKQYKITDPRKEIARTAKHKILTQSTDN